MSTKLRVFVSSTMRDLGDARRSVVARLRSLNLEPVNAEEMHPDGGSSWDVIRGEIEASHLFILLSGDTYGWVPSVGPGAGLGRSVSHMEVLHANALGMPILPFSSVWDTMHRVTLRTLYRVTILGERSVNGKLAASGENSSG